MTARRFVKNVAIIPPKALVKSLASVSKNDYQLKSNSAKSICGFTGTFQTVFVMLPNGEPSNLETAAKFTPKIFSRFDFHPNIFDWRPST